MAGVIQQLKQARERAQKEVELIDAALTALDGWVSSGMTLRPRRKLSAAGRARIAAAQRKKWAKFRQIKRASAS